MVVSLLLWIMFWENWWPGQPGNELNILRTWSWSACKYSSLFYFFWDNCRFSVEQKKVNTPSRPKMIVRLTSSTFVLCTDVPGGYQAAYIKTQNFPTWALDQNCSEKQWIYREGKAKLWHNDTFWEKSRIRHPSSQLLQNSGTSNIFVISSS